MKSTEIKAILFDIMINKESLRTKIESLEKMEQEKLHELRVALNEESTAEKTEQPE